MAATGGLRPRCNIFVGKDIVVVHYLLLLLLLLELELTGAMILVVGRGHDGTNIYFVLEYINPIQEIPGKMQRYEPFSGGTRENSAASVQRTRWTITA